MEKHIQTSNYTQGYSSHTLATHQSRTAESAAAFVLSHIKMTDHLLDVGCGPSTITTGLAKYASQGKVIGVDISTAVLQKAKTLAAEAGVPMEGPGCVVFEQGDVLDVLDYSDDSFDIVYCCQLFGHMALPGQPLRALTEIRRVLKPGGILATSDTASQHFYPQTLDLERLWVRNLSLSIRKGRSEDEEPPGTCMPSLMRKAGFGAESGEVRMGASASVCSGVEGRRWLASRGAGQLQHGDAFRQSWLDAGITEEEIRQTLVAIEEWAGMEDAWYASLQCEMLAWK